MVNHAVFLLYDNIYFYWISSMSVGMEDLLEIHFLSSSFVLHRTWMDSCFWDIMFFHNFPISFLICIISSCSAWPYVYRVSSVCVSAAYLHVSPIMQYLLLKAILSAQCNTAVSFQILQLALCFTPFSGTPQKEMKGRNLKYYKQLCNIYKCQVWHFWCDGTWNYFNCLVASPIMWKIDNGCGALTCVAAWLACCPCPS